MAFAAKIRDWEKIVRQSDWKLVRSLPLFSAMSEANFEELLNAAFLQRFPQHVTGKRTGIFANSGLLVRQRLKIAA